MRLKLSELEVGRTLGTGMCGKVKYAKHPGTGEEYALKVMRESYFKNATPEVELSAMKTLSHPNILKLAAIRRVRKVVILVTEFCEGGDVFGLIERYPTGAPEHLCANVIAGAASALDYCHSRGIAHRDIKPENLLLHKGMIKVCDFGLAHVIKGRQSIMHTAVGSPPYVAPEIARGEEYTCKIDTWSLGVVLYVLLTGRMPFGNGRDGPATLAKISAGKYEKPDVSSDALALLEQMLCLDPERRASMRQILNSAWVQRLVSPQMITPVGVANGKADENKFTLPPLPTSREEKTDIQPQMPARRRRTSICSVASSEFKNFADDPRADMSSAASSVASDLSDDDLEEYASNRSTRERRPSIGSESGAPARPTARKVVAGNRGANASSSQRRPAAPTLQALPE